MTAGPLKSAPWEPLILKLNKELVNLVNGLSQTIRSLGNLTTILTSILAAFLTLSLMFVVYQKREPILKFISAQIYKLASPSPTAPTRRAPPTPTVHSSDNVTTVRVFANILTAYLSFTATFALIFGDNPFLQTLLGGFTVFLVTAATIFLPTEFDWAEVRQYHASVKAEEIAEPLPANPDNTWAYSDAEISHIANNAEVDDVKVEVLKHWQKFANDGATEGQDSLARGEQSSTKIELASLTATATTPPPAPIAEIESSPPLIEVRTAPETKEPSPAPATQEPEPETEDAPAQA